jgi:uncharacterized membrane protein
MARSPLDRLALLFSIALCLLAESPSTAEAQGTGGSFGGGSWDSGGGGNDGGGGGGSDSGAWIVFSIVRILLVTVGPIPTLIIVVIGAAAWTWLRPRRQLGAGYGVPPAPTSPAWSHVDITALRIAIDTRARRALADRVAHLSRRASASSKAGLLALLRANVGALEQLRETWRYVGVSNFHPMSPPLAEHHFRQLSETARAPASRPGPPPPSAPPEPVEGVVLVTVIVAARRVLLDVHGHDVAALSAALDGLHRLVPDDLVAVDVIWDPADREAISASELEARGLGMVRIAP